MRTNYANTLNNLRKFDQQHLLKYWDDLSDAESDSLCSDLHEIDSVDPLELISKSRTSKECLESIDFTKSSTKDTKIDRYYHIEPKIHDDYEHRGLKAVSDGNLALIVLAGGLSTRLSINFPKGIYSVDLLSSKSLFQLQAERILRIKYLANQKYFLTLVIQNNFNLFLPKCVFIPYFIPLLMDKYERLRDVRISGYSH